MQMSFRSRSSAWLSIVAIAIAVATGLFGLTGIASAQDAQTATVQLDPENDSGVSGTATLTANGNQTKIDIALVGSEAGYEGHTFDSSCDDHQSATAFYGIEPVDENGKSTSVVDLPFDELTNGEYYIHIHRPAGERGEGVACGHVQSISGTGGGSLPGTGIGPASSDTIATWTILGMAAIAFLLLGASRKVRPSEVTRRIR
jgi:hypothetical protein